MLYNCAQASICIAAYLGICFAQSKDVPTDAAAALANEWDDPASTMSCLRALRAYVTFPPTGSFVSDVETEARRNLLLGASPFEQPQLEELYKVAQKRADFLETLAGANNLHTLEEPLFNEAGAQIRQIYGMVGGKAKLAEVQAAAAQKNFPLALYQLLSAFPNGRINRPFAEALEVFRACYKIDPQKLFDAVSKLIAPKS
jgi:hypothetical protein